MADDFQDKLNSILSTPDIMKSIAALAGSLGSPVPQNAGDDDAERSFSSDEAAANLASMVNNLSDGNDSRINLLYALKPYMRSGRANQMDMAIKILKLTKLTSLL
ncbi:MAG: hypothetical protein IJ365_05125 [Clostridia bacterium]|nr:hypothetical protein [Clostridia bacterium]